MITPIFCSKELVSAFTVIAQLSKFFLIAFSNIGSSYRCVNVYWSIYLVNSAAWIDKCRPDILITESTYATTIRDSKRYCVLRKVLHKCNDRPCENVEFRVAEHIASMDSTNVLQITVDGNPHWAPSSWFSLRITESQLPRIC